MFRYSLLAAVLNSLLFSTASAEVIVRPPDLQPGDSYRLMFTTAEKRDATSSDADVYNAFVQNAANASPELLALDLEWRAYVGTEVRSPAENAWLEWDEEDIDAGEPIYLLDGRLIAENNAGFYTGLSAGMLTNSDLDQFGNSILHSNLVISPNEPIIEIPVWTGSGFSGDSSGSLGRVARPRAAIADAGPTAYALTREAGLQVNFHSNSYPAHFHALSSVITIPVPEPSATMQTLIVLAVLACQRRARTGILK